MPTEHALSSVLFLNRLKLLDQHDPKQPDDVYKVDAEDGIGGDDAADALRYLVATKPRECLVRKLTGL